MTTYPFSQLPVSVQAQAISYDGTEFITFAKPVYDGFVRFAIGFYKDIDEMLARGWLVINRMA